MTGLLLVFRVTPRMTSGHLLFAGGMAAYVLVEVRVEERDLRTVFGPEYERYAAHVPALVPRPWRRWE